MSKPVNPFVLILGMHRSGTSCLAGSLQERGLFLGGVKEYSPFNKKGNRENPEIFTVQEAILVENGGSWDNPPKVNDWSGEHRQRLADIINSYPGNSPCGIKDPRTTLMVDKWLELLSGRPVELVASFRHPLACAASLNKRNNMPIEQGMELWRVYNESLVECIGNRSVYLVDFDQSREQYEEKVNRISEALGMDRLSDPDFYSADLITAKLTGQPYELPAHIQKLYKKLQDYSLD